MKFPETPEALWDEFYPRLLVYLGAFRGLSREDREEVASDSLLKAWQNRHAVRPESDCRAWLFTIARRSAIDRLRAERGGNKDSGFEPDDHADLRTPCPEREILKREETVFVRNFLAGLPVTSRELAFLHYYETMTVEEASKVLGMSPGTVKWKLHEIRKELQRRWDDAYGE